MRLVSLKYRPPKSALIRAPFLHGLGAKNCVFKPFKFSITEDIAIERTNHLTTDALENACKTLAATLLK